MDSNLLLFLFFVLLFLAIVYFVTKKSRAKLLEKFKPYQDNHILLQTDAYIEGFFRVLQMDVKYGDQVSENISLGPGNPVPVPYGAEITIKSQKFGALGKPFKVDEKPDYQMLQVSSSKGKIFKPATWFLLFVMIGMNIIALFELIDKAYIDVIQDYTLKLLLALVVIRILSNIFIKPNIIFIKKAKAV